MLFLNNYHVSRIRLIFKRLFLCIAGVFLAGNLVSLAINDPVRVKAGSYMLRKGFPLFVSGDEYIRMMKKYPYNPGVKYQVYRVGSGESLWDIAHRNRISIDTLIAANPFLKSLLAEEGTDLVIPAEDGVLFVFDNSVDVLRMYFELGAARPRGEFLPGLFRVISTDDVRLVFFPRAVPVLVNESLDKLYALRRVFRSPLSGGYSSLFGDRVDPMMEGIMFHNGVDIMCSYNSPIHPTRDGMVIFAGWRDGYGKTVILQHHDGYGSLYAHCSTINVSIGDWAGTNDIIGYAGSTGRSTGTHLHFTLWRHGILINPLLVIW